MKKAQKFKQFVCVNYTIEEFTYLHDVMDSSYDKITNIQSTCKVLYIVIATFYSSIYFVLFELWWIEIGDISNIFLKIKQKWDFIRLY